MRNLRIITTTGEIVIPEGNFIEIKGAGVLIKRDETGAFKIFQCPSQAIPRNKGSKTPQAGDVMPDGSICGGISPESGRPFFVTAADAPKLMSHWDAVAYARDLQTHGHRDWTLPTIGELNVLYANRRRGALAGTFNESGSFPASFYWSFLEDTNGFVRSQRFSHGAQYPFIKNQEVAVRCIRR